MKNLIDTLKLSIILTAFGALASASAQAAPTPDQTRAEMAKAFGFKPAFVDRIPDIAVNSFWAQMSGFQMNPATALSGKQKELIGLGVSSQIPCQYCIYAHTKFGELNGASRAELSEAVATASQVRFWSTWLNGTQVDEAKFKADLERGLQNIAKLTAPPKFGDVKDAAAARAEVTALFGFVPDFLAKVPDVLLPSAWIGFRDVQVAPGKVDDKTRSLIGLAVAAQIPCRYCIVAHTLFAKADGATDNEVAEAVAMGAMTREFSTILNGTQVDLAGWMKDIDRAVANARKAAAAPH